MTEQVGVSLNHKQWQVLQSQATETFFVGGLGMGKTFILAQAVLQASTVMGANILLAAPTHDTMRDSTWKQTVKAYDSMGIHEGEHYVVNEKPPRHWGVKPYSRLPLQRIVTFRWGSYIQLGNMQDFDKYRGTDYDFIGLDEFRDIDPASRDVLLPRLRGAAYMAAGLKSRILYVTTPPENPRYLKALRDMGDPDIAFFTGTTHDNAHNLPVNYIQSLQSRYDTLTFRREVLGELLTYATARFLYAWNPDEHPRVLDPNFSFPAYVAFDFNVTPMTCIVAQHYKGSIFVVKEFSEPNMDIWKFCALIKPYLDKFPAVYVTGDASGRNRSGLARENTNYYTVIQEQLKVADRFIDTPLQNPTHVNSRVLCNSLFEKHPALYIDYRCTGLIEDIELVQVNEKAEIVKSDPKLTHLLDCLRYYLHTYHLEWLDKYMERGRRAR